MKVILTTTVKKLGAIGDTVTVKSGYARNFLFPNKMALRDNKKNSEFYDKINYEIKKNEVLKINDANDLIAKLKKIEIIFKKEADEKDQLYGSISKKEILEYLADKEIKIKSDDILIKKPIKSLGEHKIEINPYENILEEIYITVNKK